MKEPLAILARHWKQQDIAVNGWGRILPRYGSTFLPEKKNVRANLGTIKQNKTKSLNNN
jgi:hypothetical protein